MPSKSKPTPKRDYDPVKFRAQVQALPDSFFDWFAGLVEQMNEPKKTDERKVA